jgi:hypothetical protein
MPPRDERGHLVLTLSRGHTALRLETLDGPIEVKLRRVRWGATAERGRVAVVVVAPKSVRVRRAPDPIGGEE